MVQNLAMRNQFERYQISEVQQDSRKLFLDWADGHRSTFHYIWLRDNCYCSECGDPRHGEKHFHVINVPENIEPLSVDWDNDQGLKIIWSPDGHTSIYDSKWLRLHCYSATEREHRVHSPILWDREIATNLPLLAYEEVRSGDIGKLQMLEYLRDYGICFLQNVPPRMGELESLAESLGPIVESNYGRVFDIVITPEESRTSVANSGRILMPHTDDAYQNSPPGIIFFHCLIASNDGSGESIFVDGFKLAQILRQEDPEGFELLCKYELCFRKRYDAGIDMQTCEPIIRLDSRGNVKGVRISNLFAAPLDMPEDLIEPFYAAYRKLMVLYTDTKYWLQKGLQPGDLVVFDNYRVLHGRTEIEMTNQSRHLRHCCVDSDYLHSQLRLLTHRLERTEAIQI